MNDQFSAVRGLRALTAAAISGFALFTLTGGSVAFYEENLPTTMNPLFAQGMVDIRTHELVFDRLYFRSAITNDLKSNLVAKSQKMDDGKKLKIYLNEGVKWHDGKPFGPKDVCFTVDALLNPKTPSPIAKNYRDTLVGCEVEKSENAAIIEFVKAYHNPRERISFAVLPEHAFESTAIAPDLDFSSRPIGTGPMSASRGRQAVTFKAFPNVHHNARISGMQSQEGGDPFVQVRTLITGGVQGVVAVAPQQRADVRASDDVALKSYDLRSWWFIALNTVKGPLSNVKVRQAVDRTIDRSELRKVTFGTEANAQNSPCEFVSGPFVGSSPYYNRSVKVRETSNKEEAQALMKAAGATEQANRWILKGEGITLRIGMNSVLDVEAKDLLNQIGNQLSEGGFDRQVHKVSNADWVQKAITGRYADEFDALIGKWSFGVVEEVNAQFSTRSGGKGSLNIFNYSNPTVDGLMDKYDAAKTDTEAQDAYHELHAFLAEDLPYIFLWKLDTKSAWRNEVRNNQIAPYYYFTEFDSWRL